MTLRELYLRLKEMAEGSSVVIERDSVQTELGSRYNIKQAEMQAHGELAKAAVNYVKKSMVAYLDAKNSLKWILGVIRSSGVRGQLLLNVFEELANYGERRRWEEALDACKKRDYI